MQWLPLNEQKMMRFMERRDITYVDRVPKDFRRQKYSFVSITSHHQLHDGVPLGSLKNWCRLDGNP